MNDNQSAYEPDDGDLTDEQIILIRDCVLQTHPVHSKESLEYYATIMRVMKLMYEDSKNAFLITI